MVVLLWIVHIAVCAFLILVVLLQSGKSADLASAFGGASTQTFFGQQGAGNMLTKLTAWCAVTFMVTSFALALVSTREGVSLLESVPAAEETVPDSSSAPAATPPADAPVDGDNTETPDSGDTPEAAEPTTDGDAGTSSTGG